MANVHKDFHGAMSYGIQYLHVLSSRQEQSLFLWMSAERITALTRRILKER